MTFWGGSPLISVASLRKTISRTWGVTGSFLTICSISVSREWLLVSPFQSRDQGLLGEIPNYAARVKHDRIRCNVHVCGNALRWRVRASPRLIGIKLGAVALVPCPNERAIRGAAVPTIGFPSLVDALVGLGANRLALPPHPSILGLAETLRKSGKTYKSHLALLLQLA